MPRKLTRLEKALIFAYTGEIVAPGATRAVGRAILAGGVRAAPPLARAAGLTNPLALGTGLGYAVTQTPQGQDLLMQAEERGRQDRLMVDRTIQDLLYGTKEKVVRGSKKAPSKFNKAVSSGLKAIKASTSYGKKGTISNAKKAFTVATKHASAAFRGKKKPKSGPSKVAYTAAKKVYKDEILRRKMK